MAYSTQPQVQVACGGELKLIELTAAPGVETVDADTLAQAQAEADAWIDDIARRVHGRGAPSPIFGSPAPTGIQLQAANEAVFNLRKYRGVASEEDFRHHDARMRWFEQLAAGLIIPEAAGYPIDTPQGDPGYFERSEDENVSRDSMKGFV